MEKGWWWGGGGLCQNLPRVALFLALIIVQHFLSPLLSRSELDILPHCVTYPDILLAPAKRRPCLRPQYNITLMNICVYPCLYVQVGCLNIICPKRLPSTGGWGVYNYDAFCTIVCVVGIVNYFVMDWAVVVSRKRTTFPKFLSLSLSLSVWTICQVGGYVWTTG